jgi:hypothetical protein
MRQLKLLLFFLIVISCNIIVIQSPLQAQTAYTHPFMIVKPAQYANLQNLTNQSPWQEMKIEALSEVNSFDPAADWINSNYWDTRKTSRMMKDFVSANTLLYIIDPTNKATYLNKAIVILKRWQDLQNVIDGDNNSVFGPNIGSAFMNSLLALDIMYADIPPLDRSDIEGKLHNVYLDMYTNNAIHYSWEEPLGGGSDVLNGYHVPGPALIALWDIYQLPTATNQTPLITEINTKASDFKNRMLDMFTADGVFKEGGLYGIARYSGDRDVIQNLPDILQFTGFDTSYYYNPLDPNNSTNLKLRQFYEWAYGYSLSPIGTYLTFGDASIYDGIYWYQQERNASSPMLGVQRLYPAGSNPVAAQYAKWRHRNPPWPYLGRLLNYVLATPQPISTSTPPSKIYPDGGGFFWEPSASTESLMGAIWNPASDTTVTTNWHSHKDVNSVVMYGYGEPILVNSGYGGDNPDVGYTHDTAASSNVVLINNVDHQKRFGNGITEWITSPTFDYASGDSGTVLSNGHQQRSYFFIHPKDGKNGYFILDDEITTTSGTNLDILFHPNTLAISGVIPQQEYQAIIRTNPHFTDTAGKSIYSPDARSPDYRLTNPSYNPTNQVELAIFLGTTPNSVTLQNSWLADWDFGFTGKSLDVNYTIPTSKTKNIITVLFPSDHTHIKAVLSRIIGTNYSGARVDHGGDIIDTAIENSSSNSITTDGVTFQGQSSIYRKNHGVISFYFVRQGKFFDDCSSNPAKQGFSSTAAVSLFLDGPKGYVFNSTTNTQLTFYYPQILRIVVDGNVSTGSTITLGLKGLHSIELVTLSDLTPTPVHTSDYYQFSAFLPTFNLTATIFDFNNLVKLLFK